MTSDGILIYGCVQCKAIMHCGLRPMERGQKEFRNFVSHFMVVRCKAGKLQKNYLKKGKFFRLDFKLQNKKGKVHKTNGGNLVKD